MADPQNIQVRVDESNLSTAYTNGFRHHVNRNEVLIDFGTSTPPPKNPATTGPQEMVFRAEHRMAMNYVTAKRLAGLMVQIVQAYEQQNGEIKMDQ